jgi:hypothetical protein
MPATATKKEKKHANRDILNLDRSLITKFGGDTKNEALREKYFKWLDAWRLGESGRLTSTLCFLLAVEFPRANLDKPKTVANGGTGENPTDY